MLIMAATAIFFIWTHVYFKKKMWATMGIILFLLQICVD